MEQEGFEQESMEQEQSELEGQEKQEVEKMNSADDIDFQIKSGSILEESGNGQMNRSGEVSKTGAMEETMEEKREEPTDPMEKKRSRPKRWGRQ